MGQEIQKNRAKADTERDAMWRWEATEEGERAL